MDAKTIVWKFDKKKKDIYIQYLPTKHWLNTKEMLILQWRKSERYHLSQKDQN